MIYRVLIIEASEAFNPVYEILRFDESTVEFNISSTSRL